MKRKTYMWKIGLPYFCNQIKKKKRKNGFYIWKRRNRGLVVTALVRGGLEKVIRVSNLERNTSMEIESEVG